MDTGNTNATGSTLTMTAMPKSQTRWYYRVFALNRA